MNLSEPLSSLMPAAEAAVLRVLARVSTGFSGRQIHMLARTSSVSGVHRALTHLVEVGLVLAERVPPAIRYTANRDHVLWTAVEHALDARRRALADIAAFLTGAVPDDIAEGVTVVLFGSVARGDSRPDSDIDLFIVTPDGMDDDTQAGLFYELGAHVRRATGNHAQIVSVDHAELLSRRDAGDGLLSNVVKDGLLVFGEPLVARQRRIAA